MGPPVLMGSVDLPVSAHLVSGAIFVRTTSTNVIPVRATIMVPVVISTMDTFAGNIIGKQYLFLNVMNKSLHL